MQDYTSITAPGDHFITEPIRPVSGDRIIAQPGARLIGGVRLTVSGVENGVCVCDLRAGGINPAPFTSRGFGRKISPAHSELFIDGRPMQLSQYPRAGAFLPITGVEEPKTSEWGAPVGTLEGGFFYEDDRPLRWKNGQDIWVHGYWAYDWSPSREKIDLFDKRRGYIRTCPPYGVFQYAAGQRFCFFNIREEVTQPGDYCIDFADGKLYFIPPEGCDPFRAELLLSTVQTPAFALENVHDVHIEGFSIEAFRACGITAAHCSDIRITGCTLKNIGNRAVTADDCTRLRIDRCTVHDTGDGGIALWCGSRETLTPGDCAVEDCEIFRVARWDRCYEPPIRLYGVGLAARRCHIHDCPHSAILYEGNDIEISGCELHDVVLETGDAGAIYAGRDYTMRGNVVEGNFLHHIGSRIGLGAMGVYNDDCLSGTVMRGNVFYAVQRAVFLGGGVDFVIENNLFIDCHPAIEADGRGQNEHPNWRRMVNVTMRDRFYNLCGKGISAAEPPYIEHYPALAKIDAAYRSGDDVSIPPSACIRGNRFCGGETIRLKWSTEGGDFREENNREIPREALPALLTPHQRAVIDA